MIKSVFDKMDFISEIQYRLHIGYNFRFQTDYISDVDSAD